MGVQMRPLRLASRVLASRIVLAALASAQTVTDAPPQIELGVTVEGEIAATDSVVHSPTLDKGYAGARQDIPPYRRQALTHTIELSSCFFDAYLLLRDAKCTRAFREAGAKTVISSLWRVRDDSTKDLMLDFYDRLWNKGESKLDALRGAQLDMLKEIREKYGDTRPATWGAFVLTGETR